MGCGIGFVRFLVVFAGGIGMIGLRALGYCANRYYGFQVAIGEFVGVYVVFQ